MQPIPGYDNYFITECGTVVSTKFKAPREIYQRVSNTGHKIVQLHSGGKTSQLLVHRLVALTYLGASHLYVLHTDGDNTNNCVTNLRYGTQSENVIDSSKHGTHPHRKLTDDEVRAIRVDTDSNKTIGRKYSVHSKTIANIKNRVTFKHVV